MIKRLRRKFIIVNMSIVTVMLAVIFGLILFFTKSNMEHDSVQLLRSVAMMPVAPDIPDKFPQKMPLSVFTVYKTNENEYSVNGNEIIDFSDHKLISEIYDLAIRSKNETGVLEEYNLRFHISHNPVHKSVFFADISDEIKTLRQLTYTCIFILIMSLVLFFVISMLLARLTVKPVETAWNQQKQFIADASHELKTPLTVIMTNAEMLLDDNHSEKKRVQFSESILTMSKQMRGLTESLLELARSDNNSREAVYEDADLSGIVSEAVLPFEPLYYEKDITLNCEIEGGLIVGGDSAGLYRLMDILLDNAMKYSYPHTEVVVRLKKHKDHCVLSVANHGDSISKLDLKNIFKRFYQIDKSRNANHSYGLGLSIAESIVKQHKGKIWAESSDGLNVFWVRLQVKALLMKNQ